MLQARHERFGRGPILGIAHDGRGQSGNLLQTQARLAELGQLAATVAHDVRNPLNIINMAAAASSPEIRQEIREQVERIARLSRDLLDYAKPWQVEPVALDLGEQVRAAARSCPGLEIGRGLQDKVILLTDTMAATGGNQSETARRLGLSPVGLIKKLTRLGLR